MMHNMEYYMDILHMDTYNLGYRLSISYVDTKLLQAFHYTLDIRVQTFIILWRTLPYQGKDLFYLGTDISIGMQSID